MKYTKEETEYIRKLVRKFEKDNKYWPWLRWFTLIAAIVCIGSATYIFYRLYNLQESLSSVFTLPKKEYNAESVKLFVEGNLMSLRLEFILSVRMLIQEAIGIALLVYSLANWKRHVKQTIILKLLRTLIPEEQITQQTLTSGSTADRD